MAFLYQVSSNSTSLFVIPVSEVFPSSSVRFRGSSIRSSSWITRWSGSVAFSSLRILLNILALYPARTLFGYFIAYASITVYRSLNTFIAYRRSCPFRSVTDTVFTKFAAGGDLDHSICLNFNSIKRA